MRRAFTLIELLVVISIIALLSGVVLASLNSAREKGRMGAGRQFDTNVYHAEADSAIGIWDFDECSGATAADRSGNGNNGALLNGPAWSTDTPSGTGCSLSFDGSNDYIDVPNESQFDLANTTFTMSIWFKTSNTALSPVLFGKTLSSGGYGVMFDGASGGIGFLIKNSLNNNGQYIAGAKATGLSNGAWHQLVAVVTTDTSVGANNNVQIYVDGALDQGSFSNTSGFVYAPTNGDFEIGRRSTGNYFNGLLDSVRVYGKGLTAREVGALYASEKGKYLASSAR